MSPAARTVTVIGATGKQGSAVARYLLSSCPDYTVRAVTRKPESDAARALANAGAEVVQADLTDAASVRAALQGTWGVFALIDFWDASVGLKEVELGTQLAHLARAAGVHIFIWSGLPDVEKITSGQWDVPHFTCKGKVWDAVLAAGLPACVSIEPPTYFLNFDTLFPYSSIYHFNRSANGGVEFVMPMLEDGALIQGFDLDDLGPPVAAVLADPDKYNGQRIVFEKGFTYPVSEMMDAFTKVTGLKPERKLLSYDDVVQLTGSTNLAEMWAYFREWGFYGQLKGRQEGLIEASDICHVPCTSFEQWLASKSSIPKQFA